MNENLPTFVVLIAKSTNTEQLQAIPEQRLVVGEAYLPGEHAGVSLRQRPAIPILFINNPAGVDDKVRRKTLDGKKALNEINFRNVGDPETHTRGSSNTNSRSGCRPAFQNWPTFPTNPMLLMRFMATTAKKPGTFANTALLARRLVERGVRFVQIYHNNWDTHSNVSGRLPRSVLRMSIRRATA